MRQSLLPFAVVAALAAAVPAQLVEPELSVNNARRVISGSRHPKTNNPYPAAGTVPKGYDSPSGVAPGTRAWTFTPRIRAQGGSRPGRAWTVRGMTMAIFTGAAVQTWPAPNHYQFKAGIAPTQRTKFPHHGRHAPTGKDIFSIGAAPVVITQWAIVEHAVTLTTPVPVGDVDLCLFVEYKGGEQRNDPKGGQTLGADWQGGFGPGWDKGARFFGFTYGSSPRQVENAGTHIFRGKIGLLVEEPVLTATGYHANFYYTPPMPREDYRSVAACYALWTTPRNQATLFFDVRAGSKYGSTGTAVVFLNVGKTWFPSKVPTQWGNLLLSPSDPAFSALASFPYVLTKGGVYSDPKRVFNVPALGAAAKGVYLKAQGVVFNAGFKDMALTSSSSIWIF